MSELTRVFRFVEQDKLIALTGKAERGDEIMSSEKPLKKAHKCLARFILCQEPATYSD